MTALLLGSVLAAGCGADQQNLEQNQAAAPAEVTGGEAARSEPPETEPVPPSASREDSRPGAQSSSDASRRPARRASGSDNVDIAGREATESRPANGSETREPAAPAPRWRELTIPAGTALPLELSTAVSTRTATLETPVTARLRDGLIVDGQTVLPAGTVFKGQVIDVERAGRVQGRARLAIRFTEATVNGQSEVIRTNPITFEGEATKGEDATKIGAGAGIGAVIGGIVGGGDGAAKGAAIGGAAGTGAVLATRGREVELTSGTDLAATTASAVTLQVER